ncbi:MAG: endolytic transglycosylase MltG [Oscillospiraceae bacterium]|nr:endolytic transglycosylase MltG [Oscillospiraceae bacterium]
MRGIIFAVSLVTVSIMLAVVILVTISDMMGVAKPDSEIRINIPRNSSTKQIADILKNEGVIRYVSLFRFYSRMQDADGYYQYGLFSLNSAMSYEDIIKNLKQISSERDDVVSVTFPEGSRLQDIAALLEENEVCSSEKFLEDINNPEFIKSLNSGEFFEKEVSENPKKYYYMEGFLFPDTYEFFTGDDTRAVAEAILKNFEEKFTLAMRERAAELDLSVEEAVILASIVQGEVSDPEEMKMCAGVFFNRINNNSVYPKLESDTTTRFLRDFIRSRIRPFDQSIYDQYIFSYSTYDSDGLPVGAICSPGADALNAVLNPTESKYYFFYSDPKGVTHFARTDYEHEQNKKTYGNF